MMAVDQKGYLFRWGCQSGELGLCIQFIPWLKYCGLAHVAFWGVKNGTTEYAEYTEKSFLKSTGPWAFRGF